MFLIFALVVVVAAAATIDEMSRRDAVLDMSRRTLTTIRELLCGMVDDDHELTIGIVVGDTHVDLAEYFEERKMRVTREERLIGAAWTDSYDFRKFGDVDAVVSLSSTAHWQELVATYRRSTVVLVLGEEFKRPTAMDTVSRLRKCVETTDRDAVSVLVETYGSGCPTTMQKAKVQDQIVAELLENAPNLRVFDNDLNPIPRESAVWTNAMLPADTRPSSRLVVCPGMGGTATHALAAALYHAGLPEVDHYAFAREYMAVAAEDEDFRWHLQHYGDAVLDTPIPGYWYELVHAFPSSLVILTTRLHGYSRDYSMQFIGRRLEEESAPRHCMSDMHCREKCAKLSLSVDQSIEILHAGYEHCRLKNLDDRDILNFSRAAAMRVLAGNGNETALPEHQERLAVYHTDCPSNIQSYKAFLNNNRHVLRRVPEDRVLVMDITRGDGYDLLCPFLGINTPQDNQEGGRGGPCAMSPRPPFPRKSNHTTMVPPQSPLRRKLEEQSRRRLHSPCYCKHILAKRRQSNVVS